MGKSVMQQMLEDIRRNKTKGATAVDDIIEQLEEKRMEDFYQTTLDDYESFDNQAWHKGDGYKLPKFKDVEDKLEGLTEGLYLFAAESNVGKSGLMLNLLYDACMCEENKLFGIYFSLDDGMNDIIARTIAMQEAIPISVVAKPQRYQNLIDLSEEGSSTFQEWLDKRIIGLEKLKSTNQRFKIVDGNRIKTSEDLEKYIKDAIIYVKSFDHDNNIIIAIDAINDINLQGKFNSTSDKHTAIAKMVKSWAATEFHIPIFASIHLRKLNANRRPTLDDLKESVEYQFEANLVWLLYSDVSKNQQSAKIYWNQEGHVGKLPIIEMHWAKNKQSSYKGHSFCFFSPELSRAAVCSPEASKRYDVLLYEN